MAKQQEISSILLQRRLRFLGHLSRMSNDCLPKQLLVFAPVGCKNDVGGQKHCWNDVVSSDLKQCNLLESWREKAESATLGAPLSNVVQSILTRNQKSKRIASEMTENDGVNSNS